MPRSICPAQSLSHPLRNQPSAKLGLSSRDRSIRAIAGYRGRSSRSRTLLRRAHRGHRRQLEAPGGQGRHFVDVPFPGPSPSRSNQDFDGTGPPMPAPGDTKRGIQLPQMGFPPQWSTTGLGRAPGRGGAGRRLAFDPRRTRCARFRFGERIIHWREEETLPGVE